MCGSVVRVTSLYIYVYIYRCVYVHSRSGPQFDTLLTVLQTPVLCNLQVSEQANKAKPKPAKAGEVAALSRPEPAEQGPPANKKGKKTSKPTNRDAVLSAVATQPLLPNHMGSLTAPVTMPGSEGDSQRKEKAPARVNERMSCLHTLIALLAGCPWSRCFSGERCCYAFVFRRIGCA